jgi:hypothetical protein
VFFIDTAKFSGKKHLRAGECQGAKKNEEKDTKKRKPRLDFRFLFYSLKKIRGTDPMINTL